MRGHSRPEVCAHGGHPPKSYCLATCYCTHCPHYVEPPAPTFKPLRGRLEIDPSTDRTYDTEE